MSGIVFYATENHDSVVRFYTETIGATVWLEQPDCTILQYENLCPGLIRFVQFPLLKGKSYLILTISILIKWGVARAAWLRAPPVTEAGGRSDRPRRLLRTARRGRAGHRRPDRLGSVVDRANGSRQPAER